MSGQEEVEKLEFNWGKRKGVGGKRKELKFYESFSYDNLEYTLYDCVYLHKEGEGDPYIGKLINIWENTDNKSKKVRVQWFFRPNEILQWIKDAEDVLWNEIFLAAGEGRGLTNINTLEAISGKCNVVCISDDPRNPLPSDEELIMADFVFYRTFDVKHLTFSDKMDDKVGGLEVTYVFNKNDNENSTVATKHGIAQNKTKDFKKREGHNSNLAKDVKKDVKKDEVKVDDRVKEGKDFRDDRPYKKAKIGNFSSLSGDKCIHRNRKLSIKANDEKASATYPNTSEGEKKSKHVKGSSVIDKVAKSTKVDSSSKVPLKEKEVTRSQYVDNSWFKQIPWEERIQGAQEQGRLVLLQNLDPKYTSIEVEELIWQAFVENCSAKMVQRTSISTRHYGEAFVIFSTRDVAERVLRKLSEGCLMLSHGRALVGCTTAVDNLHGKQCTYYGHLAIDKVKLKMQKDMKDVLSTSHCSQPNTIEYEMAMEWCLLHSRSDAWWKRLHKKQGEELRKLKADLKSK